VKPTHQFRPRLERLDDRDLPSATPGLIWTQAAQALHLLVPAVAGHAGIVQNHQLALQGTITGTWARAPGIPDVGGQQGLAGTGTLKTLGTVAAMGTIHTPGFIRAGHATGTLTLTNARGTVTLQLTGPEQPGFSPPPNSFTYQIVSGSGAYAGATGHGTVTLAETAAGTFSMTFSPA
jgi:hypothetical protein